MTTNLHENNHVHIIHTGEKMNPDICPHPGEKLYTWFAHDPNRKVLCAVCLQCNTVIAGAAQEKETT